MPYRAWFQCISGCEEKYELNEVIYQCKSGDLLEVKHDIDKLRRHTPEHWKKLLTSGIGVPGGLMGVLSGARRSGFVPQLIMRT